jgi:thioredoxin-dependent peroxiredoxin
VPRRSAKATPGRGAIVPSDLADGVRAALARDAKAFTEGIVKAFSDALARLPPAVRAKLGAHFGAETSQALGDLVVEQVAGKAKPRALPKASKTPARPARTKPAAKGAAKAASRTKPAAKGAAKAASRTKPAAKGAAKATSRTKPAAKGAAKATSRTKPAAKGAAKAAGRAKAPARAQGSRK